MLATGRQLHPDGTFTQCEPMDVWVVSKDFSGSKSLVREVAECCQWLAADDPDFEVDAQQTAVHFKTGKSVVALPCSGAACRGKTGAVLFDEVAFWRQMEDVWAAAKIIANPNLGERRGYPVLLVTTPWDEDSLAFRLFNDKAYPFRRHRVDIYDAVRAKFPIDPERERLELGIEELFATEYLCKWARGGASFFSFDKLRNCQVDDEVLFGPDGRIVQVVNSGLPQGWQDAPCRVGVDIGGGRGRDFTAVVQWRAIQSAQWMVGLKAFNNLPIDLQVETAGDWILAMPGHVSVEIRCDQGIMGFDFIRLLALKLGKRRNTRILPVSMNPTDQERYAVAGRRLLERGQMRLYTGAEAGGDENGARALMLELSQLKAKPGLGGHLSFATPRDRTKGHLDRAWASLIGLDEADEAQFPVRQVTPAQVRRMSSGGRWGGMTGRGFG